MNVETIKVLSIEDNPGDARLIQAMLAQARSLAWDLPQFELEWVQTLADGLARLDQGGIEVVLSDLDLPDSRAGDTFTSVHTYAPEVPIVVLTGREDEELARHTVRAGAEDYLFKREMNGPLLAYALIYAIERQQTKQALQQAHGELERRVEKRTAELYTANESLQREIIEHKQTAETLRGREARLQSIFRAAPIGIGLVSDRILLQVNNRICEMIGRPSEELIGKSAQVLYPTKGEFERVGREKYAQIHQNGTGTIETQWQHSDGRIVDVMLSSTPLDPNDLSAGVTFTALDITEHRRAEDLLRAQRDLGLELSIAQGIDETLRFCLEAAIRISGMDCGGIYLVDETSGDLSLVIQKGLPTAFVENASHYAADSANARLVMAGEPIYTRHRSLDTPMDSARRRESLRALAIVPVPHEGQIIACLNVASHTIDEVPDFARSGLETIAAQVGGTIAHSRVEEALRESEGRYRSLFANNHSVMLLIDPETGDIVDANPAACAYYGYGKDELTALRISDINILSESQIFDEMQRAKSKAREHFFFRHRLANGQVRDVEVYSGPIIFHGKQFLYSIVHDVTARKQAEAQLQHYAIELQRSNQELQQFAHIVSHDLREPLRVANGFLRLLEEEYAAQLDAQAREYIQYAKDRTGRMQTMIKALLEYSRAGTQDTEFVPIDCEAVLRYTLLDLQVAIEEEEATITHDPLPTVPADETQLAQVFQNLVGNALKYRSEEPPRIHLSARREGDNWLFAVQDNGIGIDPAQAERIFQIFQRLHTQDEYEGTGIGLALCQKIVERHGGRIWVESQLGQGSTFYFTIPIIDPSGRYRGSTARL